MSVIVAAPNVGGLPEDEVDEVRGRGKGRWFWWSLVHI